MRFVLSGFLFLLVSPFVIPAQLALAEPSIEDFVREADVRDMELSPDGRHLATLYNESDQGLVIVRNLDAPDMPVVGALSEEVVRPSWLYWGNNERLLISLSVPLNMRKARMLQRRGDFDGDDFDSVSRMLSVNTDMSDMAVMMEDERRLKRNTSLSRVTNFLPGVPDHVLMAAIKNSKRMLYRVNVDTGKAENVAIGSSHTFKFLNDDEGNPLYRFDYRRRSKTIELFRFEEDDEWELIDKISLSKDDEDGLENNDLVALSLDNLVYRKRNEESGYYELVVVDRATREQTTLVSLDGQDVYGILIDNRSDQIVGYSVENDYVRYVYFDESKQEQYDAIEARIGDYNFTVSSLQPERKRALVTVSGANSPRSYLLWDFESQELSYLDHAYYGLPSEKLSAPAATTYSARDGTPIRAYFLVPQSYEPGKKYPTIILPHGGPNARSRPAYNAFAQFLSTRGYIIVEPNFRGSVGYGRDFEVAGYKQWGGVMQDDLTDSVEFMVANGFTDPERICIVGGSYGGYAALMGAIKTPDLFKCAISLNGVTNLVDQIKYDMSNIVEKDEWAEFLFDRIGHPEIDRDLLDANSPALHADKIRIPVMIIAGTEDERVPYSQSKQMVKALKKAGVEYEFITLWDTGHNPFYYREDMETVFEAVEGFLARYLN